MNMNLEKLHTPFLILDKEKMERNISSMALRAKKFGVDLRPHIKTHKCIEIGKMQKKAGAKGITVSSLLEAEIFAEENFDDITYAVPLSKSTYEKAVELNNDISLNILIDAPDILERLSEKAKVSRIEIGVLVKVDCGYHRCGIIPFEPSAIKLVEEIASYKWLNFKGILTHAGHAYSAKSVQEIRKIAVQEQETMVAFAQILSNHNEDLKPEIVSIGSTPTISLSNEILDGITEVRPGNYVFYDYTQTVLGSCSIPDCALTVISTILGRYGNRLVIDAGATALSKDSGPTHIDGDCGYGRIFKNYEKGLLDHSSRIENLSQEHGKISLTDGSELLSSKSGDRLRILPNHSCLANNLFNKVYVAKGSDIKDTWKIHRGHQL